MGRNGNGRREKTGKQEQTFKGVQNSDNSTAYEQADEKLKCLWFAFASAEKDADTSEQEADLFYQANKSLLAKSEWWDDSTAAKKLGDKFSYTMLSKLMSLSAIAKDQANVPGTKIVALHEVAKVPAGAENYDSIDDLTKHVLADANIELHAINGKVDPKGKINWRSYGKSHNVTATHKLAVVFRKLPA